MLKNKLSGDYMHTIRIDKMNMVAETQTMQLGLDETFDVMY